MQEAVFFFQKISEYRVNTKVAMGATEGTVQEGSIPTWMEVDFVTTFISQKFPNYFFLRIYIN